MGNFCSSLHAKTAIKFLSYTDYEDMVISLLLMRNVTVGETERLTTFHTQRWIVDLNVMLTLFRA